MQSILQTKEWANFKESQGFEILKLGELFVHKRQLPLGQNFLYLPEVDSDNITPNQIAELKKLTKGQNSIFARLELLNKFAENSHKLVLSLGLIPAFEQVQPKWRQIVDLTKTTGEILAQMKQKGRYNVKLSERKGVKIEKGASQAIISSFHKMYIETVSRERISSRGINYFKKMIDSFKETDYIQIYTAKYNNETVAAALISFSDGVATYLYGGSSRRHKEVMAPYLMHWQIIKDAKENGCKMYDLQGRAKPGDEKSNWAGITKFKEQFGGIAVELLGSYDYISKPAFYQIFKLAEKIRRKQA